MNRNLKFAGVVSVVILLAVAAPALAGGWATITVDEWPTQIVANEPVDIGFTVRQHGRDDRRLSGLSPTLTAKNTATGKSIVVNAKDEGAAGHYVALITFPEAGAWSWSIQAFSMDQPMPDLLVNEPAASVLSASPLAPNLFALTALNIAGFSFTPAILAGVLGLVFVCLAIGLAWRKRTRWALALVFVGLLAWGAGVASAASKPAGFAPPENKPVAGIVPAGKPVSQEEFGKILFVAKGCVTCHVNPRVEAAFIPFQVDVGKNLTGYVASPEFLRIWLKDPKAVKPNTEMPNLELSQAEIEALIVFLNPPAEVK
jgi:hypothetical protein